MPQPDPQDGIPFTFFASLIREIAKDTDPNVKRDPAKTFKRWLKRLRETNPTPPKGTTTLVFRFLFPHEDVRRKFDMQECTLSRELAKCLGLSDNSFENWDKIGDTVCLGDQLYKLLSRICSDPDEISTLSMGDVDALLEELAAISRFSDREIRLKFPRSKRRKRDAILKDLFRPLTPFDAACVVQIILKDLRPLMYPLCEKQLHVTSALNNFNANSVKELDRKSAMQTWDSSLSLWRSHRLCFSLEDAAGAFEKNQPITELKLNTQLEVPKSQKARGLHHALSYFEGSKTVWAETKYDGERAQIHVQFKKDERNEKKAHIKIFSKSQRDSTNDRADTHSVIIECLSGANVKDIILDAEMVAFTDGQIDSFWLIRGIIDRTAKGARSKKQKTPEPVFDTQDTGFTQDVEELDGQSHLGLVFFDIMYLNGESLMDTPYHERRRRLESVIKVVPGRAMLARRHEIDMKRTGLSSWAPAPKRKLGEHDSSDNALARTLAHTLASHEEGLVLKAGNSNYNDWRLPWVKLKMDYVHGLWDTVDLVLLGAGWDKSRGGELRVPRETHTTFYIGALQNADEYRANPDNIRPSFHIYFTVSYGPNRKELEELNYLINSNKPIPYSSRKGLASLPYDFTLDTHLVPPVCLLSKPLLADVYGDRFTKTHEGAFFEIRWPRITKVHRPSERSWKDGLSMAEIQAAASVAMGFENSVPHNLDRGRLFKGKAAILPEDDWEIRYLKWQKRLGLDVEINEQPQKRPRLQGLASFALPRPQTHISAKPTPSLLNSDFPTSTMSTHVSSQLFRASTNLPSASCPRSTQNSSTAPSEQPDSENILPSSTIPPPPSPTIRRQYPSPPTSPMTPRTRTTPTSRPVKNIRRRDRLKVRAGTANTQLFQKVDESQLQTQTKIETNQSPGGVMLEFLRHALIWYDALPEFGGNEEKDREAAASLCRSNRVHSPEALITGAGWHPTTPSSPWVEQGVVFLGEGTMATREFEKEVLGALQPRLAKIPVGVRKPIWIFDRLKFDWDRPYYEQALTVIR